MTEIFPLTPSLWQQWIKDELSLNTSKNDAFSTVVKLYERAVFDYLVSTIFFVRILVVLSLHC